MSSFIKKIPTPVKMIAAILSPLILTVVAFYVYGIQVKDADQIYPHITIAGTDVSGLTREQAMLSLGLPEYEKRSAGANVTFIFPDESELTISGSDANLHHNAHELVSQAHSIGRGQGVLRDTISYLLRYNADVIAFDIEFFLDSEMLKSLVTTYTNDYNYSLNSSIPAVFDDHIVFTKGAGHIVADAGEIFEIAYDGLYKSLNEGHPVVVVYSLPETALKFGAEIIELRDSIFVQMVSSEYDPTSNSASECAVGVDFDTVAAAFLIRDIEPGQSTTIYLDFTYPEYTQEYLDSVLFRDLIGERTTSVGGTESRAGNIDISSKAIDGLVLKPGEEFSFNETVGPRTVERGYRYAPAIINNEFVPSIGGGICQTSSTIYAAIRPTELLVTARQAHRRPISYLPPGWDATVFWGLIDFKFVNNTDYPIRINIELDGRRLTAQVWGTIKDDFPRAADWNE